MAYIIDVEKGSIAEELGIKKGDELLSFDGIDVEDILDYIYYDAQERFVMTVRRGKEETDYEIEKDLDETLGLTLDESCELTPIRCKNKCVFCFVDQLPKGMRDTLYVKDDDYRLSFVSGNYVTFTNVGQKELDRIVRLRLSPLYVSVHCYDREIKRKMVANPEGAELFDKMRFLADGGITMHTQIVLCKGLNDGAVLDETLRELAGLYPSVASVAVVPVGLTGHRDGLYPLEPIDADTAAKVIETVESFNAPYDKDGGFCWCSDEFYIKAGRDVPRGEYYADYPQIENGVGLVRQFIDDTEYALDRTRLNRKKGKISFITGQSFKGTLNGVIPTIKEAFPKLDIQVYDVVNRFFGESITVAGLLTGRDMIDALKGKISGHTIIPSNMLREFTDTFLDGVTVPEMERELGIKIHVSHGGADNIRIISEVLNNER